MVQMSGKAIRKKVQRAAIENNITLEEEDLASVVHCRNNIRKSSTSSDSTVQSVASSSSSNTSAQNKAPRKIKIKPNANAAAKLAKLAKSTEGDSQSSAWPCNICPKICNSRDELGCHIRWEHFSPGVAKPATTTPISATPIPSPLPSPKDKTKSKAPGVRQRSQGACEPSGQKRKRKHKLNGDICDNNSNSIVLTAYNGNGNDNGNGSHKGVEIDLIETPLTPPIIVAAEPKVEPLSRIQSNVLNTTTASATKSKTKTKPCDRFAKQQPPKPKQIRPTSVQVVQDGDSQDPRNKQRPLKTYSRTQKQPSSTAIVVPLSGGSDYSDTRVHCRRCRRDFRNREAWTHHVVHFHIKARNPYPIVEMNYVDPATLKSRFSKLISTNNPEVVTVSASLSAEAEKVKGQTETGQTGQSHQNQTHTPPTQTQTQSATATAASKAFDELKLRIVCRKSSQKRSYTILRRTSTPPEEGSDSTTTNDAVQASCEINSASDKSTKSESALISTDTRAKWNSGEQSPKQDNESNQSVPPLEPSPHKRARVVKNKSKPRRVRSRSTSTSKRSHHHKNHRKVREHHLRRTKSYPEPAVVPELPQLIPLSAAAPLLSPPSETNKADELQPPQLVEEPASTNNDLNESTVTLRLVTSDKDKVQSEGSPCELPDAAEKTSEVQPDLPDAADLELTAAVKSITIPSPAASPNPSLEAADAPYEITANDLPLILSSVITNTSSSKSPSVASPISCPSPSPHCSSPRQEKDDHDHEPIVIDPPIDETNISSDPNPPSPPAINNSEVSVACVTREQKSEQSFTEGAQDLACQESEAQDEEQEPEQGVDENENSGAPNSPKSTTSSPSPSVPDSAPSSPASTQPPSSPSASAPNESVPVVSDSAPSSPATLQEIISSNPKPLRRPITIGSMSIIPADFSPETQDQDQNINSSSPLESQAQAPELEIVSPSSSPLPLSVRASPSPPPPPPRPVTEEAESESEEGPPDGNNNDDLPEAILPLTEDELEEERMISHDKQASDTTITSSANELSNGTINGSGSGMLPKKKQFITSMRMENEIRERACNGDGSTRSTPDKDTSTADGSSSDERNNNYSKSVSANTSPKTTRPNSTQPPDFSQQQPQFENITPPNSEETDAHDHDHEEQEREPENLVIRVRPEYVELAGGPDERTEQPRPQRSDSRTETQDSENTNNATRRTEEIIHEAGPRDDDDEDTYPNQQNDSDDFMCRVCHKIFPSDAEVKAHFNAVHLRIGSLRSSIFEPESPHPSQPQQSERVEPSQEELNSQAQQANFTRHTASVEFERQRAVIMESQRRHSAEILSHSQTRANQVLGNHQQMRPTRMAHTGFQQLQQQQQQMQLQRDFQGSMNGPRYASNLLQRQTPSRPGSLPRPQFANASTNAPRHPGPYNPRMQQQQQQHIPRHSVVTGSGPTSAQNQQTLQQQQYLQLQAQQQLQIQQQQRQRLLLQQQQQQQREQVQGVNNRTNFITTGSGTLQRSHSNESSHGGRPAQIIRHNSLDQDGPRIVEVSSMGRTLVQNESASRAYQNQTHTRTAPPQQVDRRMINVHSNLQGATQNIQNLLQAKRASMEVERAAAAKQPRLDNTSNQNQMRTQSQIIQQQQQLQQQQQQQINQQRASQMLVTSRPIYQQADVPSRAQRPSPPVERVDREVIPSMRLGNSITLSVCPTTEPSTSTAPHRSEISVSPVSVNANNGYSNSSLSFTPMSTDAVASALAIRGVTVTPAVSQPEQITVSRRSPVNISISAAATEMRHSPIISPTQRATRSPISPSNMNRVPMHSPPIQQQPPPAHQFAIPRGPAPRGMYNTAPPTVNPSMERPDRPPTVDLTEDEVNQHAREASANRLQQMQTQLQGGGRQASPSSTLTIHPANSSQINQARMQSTSRQTVSCSICGVLYPSLQALEEHRMSHHGIPPVQVQRSVISTSPATLSTANPQRMVSPVGNTAMGGSRQLVPRPSSQGQSQMVSQQQAQGQLRPSVTARGASHQQQDNNRYLYIPLIDMSRLDSSRIRRLEDLGILSMMPLHGNERTGAQMGIPVLSLRPELRNQHLPWDSVLPVGPVQSIGNTEITNTPRGQINGQQQTTNVTTIHHHQQR